MKEFFTREDMLDSVTTWTQGSFCPEPRVARRFSPEDKAQMERREKHLLRTGRRENALAEFTFPEDAAWVAKALNERVILARELARSERHLFQVLGITKSEAHWAVEQWKEHYPLAAKWVAEIKKDDEFMQSTLAHAERFGEINKSDMKKFCEIVRRYYPEPPRETMEDIQARSRVLRPGQRPEVRYIQAGEDMVPPPKREEPPKCICQGFHRVRHCPVHGERRN